MFVGKIFNITGACQPDLHYMTDISPRLAEMRKLIARGEYFTLNRARQYGKTTTLRALKEYLKDEYYVVSMDFQMQMSHAKFRSENTFSVAFAKAFARVLRNSAAEFTDETEYAIQRLSAAARENREEIELVELFQYISDICKSADRPIVLMIDEADSASNHRVFLDFLSQLRGYYIDREQSPTFQSVILAGVYDIRYLKSRFLHKEQHGKNSPWNIAVEFKGDMSFSAAEIAGMLDEYEEDHETGMNVAEIAELIYDYTAGYPFLVSKLCRIMDEEVCGSEDFSEKHMAWTYAGFLKAQRILLEEKNPLFESMVNKMYDFPELKHMIYSMLFTGKEHSYNALDQAIGMAEMFGFIKNENGTALIANRMFETVFYNFFLTSSENQNTDIYKAAIQDKNQFVSAGHLNMELILEKFVMHFGDLYGECSDRFKEEDGRRFFLLYLRPIINGTGNYYVESRTRNMERTDVIVDYRGEQMVVELKIWRGNAYHERGEDQLLGYLEHYHLKKGYMLSFNFNQKKKVGMKRMRFGDKVLIEAVV